MTGDFPGFGLPAEWAYPAEEGCFTWQEGNRDGSLQVDGPVGLCSQR